MINLDVAGTTVSSYYLADPGLFLREQMEAAGVSERVEGVGDAQVALRRLVNGVDETSNVGTVKKAVAAFLASFGWVIDDGARSAEGIPADAVGRDASGAAVAWIVLAPGGQHLDASPTGRRAGNLRPQRRAELSLRTGDLPVAIVTNGTEMRLVRRDPGLGGEATYVSLALPGLWRDADPHEWAVVWALLRPEAFLPDGDGGPSLWEQTERASEDAAAKVSEDLALGVRTAITSLADGALADLRLRDHGAGPPEPRQMFADAMKIAYRLLFVAYAEDRGLLPVAVPAWRSGYSLARLRELVEDRSLVWEPDGGFLWASLRAQWLLLREGAGDAGGELQVAAYNGSLFDPESCPLLDDPDLTVGDAAVAEALRGLFFTQPTRRGRRVVQPRRINYRELGVEQLGSVYEGLLAYEPRIADEDLVVAASGSGAKRIVQLVPVHQLPDDAEELERHPAGTFILFAATGQRKGTGSYYTPRALAHFLVREALEPLVRDATPDEILSLRVLDPAMGSAAFLVPAVHFLAEAYGDALIRTGIDIDGQLDDTERAAYRRLIVERCIHGVDRNLMAVELAKVSLWLATAAAGKPLSFLDANLRWGDSLVGSDVSTFHNVPAPLLKGRRGGTDVDENLPRLFEVDPLQDLKDVVASRLRLADAPSEDRLDVRRKAAEWHRLLESPEWARLRALGDWWVAPFFEPALAKQRVRWLDSRWDMVENGIDVAPPEVAAVRERVVPFHWEIEFPEVFFTPDGTRRDDAGFDVIVGNPPWEGVTFKAAEFYGRFDATYAFCRTKEAKAERADLLLSRAEVKQAKLDEDQRIESLKSFIKTSGHYRMLGTKGTFNLYRAFLERDLDLLAPNGRLGLAIDAGLAGDAGTQYHRRELLDHCTIDRFILVDNINKIFPIDSREQFVLLVAGRGGSTDVLPFTSGVDELNHLNDLDDRTTPIRRTVLEALAPETLAIPDVRDPVLLDLLGAIYAEHPLLLSNGHSSWRCTYQREIYIDDHRDCFDVGAPGRPLREGKHLHQFVHDFAEPTYHLNELGEQTLLRWERRRSGLLGVDIRRSGERHLTEARRGGALEVPTDHFRPVIRDTASATNERTLIAAVEPPGLALGHSAPFFHRSSCDRTTRVYETDLPAAAMAYLVAVLNSVVLDFVARRKVANHLTKAILATLPVPDIDLDSEAARRIVSLSGRLCCRTAEFGELAEVLGVTCGPLDAAEEFALRAELDALIAQLYGLTAAQVDQVLADFRQSEAAESSPVRPDDAYKDAVRANFARLDVDPTAVSMESL